MKKTGRNKKKQDRPYRGKGRSTARGLSNEALAMVASKLAVTLCASEGLDLVHVESISNDDRRILRIYIHKEGGVNLELCTFISRQMGDLLDVNIEGNEKYFLEVSSPGTDRTLTADEDFEKKAGRKIKMKFVEAFEGQKTITGVLDGFSDGKVTMTVDGETIAFDRQQISRAWLVGK